MIVSRTRRILQRDLEIAAGLAAVVYTRIGCLSAARYP
jgi:hypothetical protein